MPPSPSRVIAAMAAIAALLVPTALGQDSASRRSAAAAAQFGKEDQGHWSGTISLSGSYDDTTPISSPDGVSGSEHHHIEIRDTWTITSTISNGGGDWQYKVSRSYSVTYSGRADWKETHGCDDGHTWKTTFNTPEATATRTVADQGAFNVDAGRVYVYLSRLDFSDAVGDATERRYDWGCVAPTDTTRHFTDHVSTPIWFGLYGTEAGITLPFSGQVASDGLPRRVHGGREISSRAGTTGINRVNQPLHGKLNVSFDLTRTADCSLDVIPRERDTQLSGGGWRVRADVSDDDGLVVRDVRLGSRYLMAELSVPYLIYQLDDGVPRRAELKPTGSSSAQEGHLASLWFDGTEGRLVAIARYEINTPGPGCLVITQDYRFHQHSPRDQCAPSTGGPPLGTPILVCSRFYPLVSYEYTGPPEKLERVTVAQRLHMRVDNSAFNAVAWIQDHDVFTPLVLLGGTPVSDRMNAVPREQSAPMIVRGGAGRWDNWHQTRKVAVEEPRFPGFWFPARNGCPECVHIHWRWSRAAGGVEGFKDANGGRPRVPAGSPQDVTVGVANYRAGEEDPIDWRVVVNGEELGTTDGGVPPEPVPEPTAEMRARPVMWYEATSSLASDSFFLHGGFAGAAHGGNPVIDAVRIRPSRFTLDRARTGLTRKPRAVLTMRSSEIASVTATVLRQRSPKPRGCRRLSTQAKCTRRSGRGVFEAGEGVTKLGFTGNLSRGKLTPGRYVMRLRPSDLTGRRGSRRMVRFTILRPRRARRASASRALTLAPATSSEPQPIPRLRWLCRLPELSGAGSSRR